MADVKNIQYWVSKCLKPTKKSGTKRKFKCDIDMRLCNKLRAMHFNGRFKDASKLIDEFNLPKLRTIEGNKVATIARIQARVSKPKKSEGYASKPAITIRFLIKFVLMDRETVLSQLKRKSEPVKRGPGRPKLTRDENVPVAAAKKDDGGGP